MKFGLCLPNFPFGVRPSREAILEVGLEAERVGYDSVWVSDHILVPKDKPRYGWLFEAFSTLAYLGGATQKIQLGTSVLILPYRDAILAAKQAATIDALTGGRLIVGVGIGWIEGEFKNLGIDFHSRGRLLDESLAVLRALWTEDDPGVDTEHYHFSDVLFGPKPVRPGGIPIWVGGHSEMALRRTVRWGDAWHADDLPMDQFVEYTRKLRAMSNGRKIGVTLRRTVDLRPTIAIATSGVGGEPAGRWPGSSATALTGRLEDIHAEIGQVADLGTEHLICQFEHQTQEEHLTQIRFLAQEIIPRFRG